MNDMHYYTINAISALSLPLYRLYFGVQPAAGGARDRVFCISFRDPMRSCIAVDLGIANEATKDNRARRKSAAGRGALLSLGLACLAAAPPFPPRARRRLGCPPPSPPSRRRGAGRLLSCQEFCID